MFIENNRLMLMEGKPVNFVESPNWSSRYTPEYCIIHYTGGANAQAAINWLCAPDAKASAHLVIDQHGAITQLVPFNKMAWHAGTSSWDSKTSLNGYSIGIELVNSGPVESNCGSFYDMWGHSYHEDEVVCLTHKNEKNPRYWVKYPKAQIESLQAVYKTLNDEFHFKDVIGHDDVSSGRKIDPGPAFPWDCLKSIDILL